VFLSDSTVAATSDRDCCWVETIVMVRIARNQKKKFQSFTGCKTLAPDILDSQW
jgi:hypothetical protein